MTVNPNVTASVSIAAAPSGAICAGTNVTFTATQPMADQRLLINGKRTEQMWEPTAQRILTIHSTMEIRYVV